MTLGPAVWPSRCVDCGAVIQLPVDLTGVAEAISEGRYVDARDTYDVATWTEVIKRHALWNPEIHPSFVKQSGGE